MSFMSWGSDITLRLFLHLEDATHKFSVGLLVKYFDVRQILLLSSGIIYNTYSMEQPILGERNWREDEWRGEFDQSDSILFVCQRRENFSSSNSIIVYISHEFYIEFPAAHRYPWCNAQSKFALSRSPSIYTIFEAIKWRHKPGQNSQRIIICSSYSLYKIWPGLWLQNSTERL